MFARVFVYEYAPSADDAAHTRPLTDTRTHNTQSRLSRAQEARAHTIKRYAHTRSPSPPNCFAGASSSRLLGALSAVWLLKLGKRKSCSSETAAANLRRHLTDSDLQSGLGCAFFSVATLRRWTQES